MFLILNLSDQLDEKAFYCDVFILTFLFSDLRGSTGSEVGEEQENERSQREEEVEEEEEEEEEDKRPAPHLLLQLTLGKELARSNR